MKYTNKIAVLGGDLRQHRAAVMLARGGRCVSLYASRDADKTDNGLNYCKTLDEALSGAAAVVLPLPSTIDGINLNAPLNNNEEKISLYDILNSADDGIIIIGGRMSEKYTKEAKERGFKVRDYFLSEEFQIENAYITAEAAISIAMNSLDRNLRGSNIAITGYGRISKQLIRLLTSLGASITVAARKSNDLAWSRTLGCSTIRLGDEAGNNIYKLANGYDIIYNTVPYRLFDRDFLEKCDKKTFIIDLASAPGGVDICAAKELHANVLWATSLPGKYAPDSAGDIIATCVEGILCEEVDKL